MSTYILMKLLESAPSRYDLGIRLLTLGQIDRSYDRLTSHIQKGWNVLDIGCGTGALTIRAAQRGAYVRGIDVNPSMLEIARKKIHDAGLDEYVKLVEKGAAELDDETGERYDAVMCGLCFSELTDDEISYVLVQIKRILKTGGLLLIADETAPCTILRRIINFLFRLPLVVITYLITQTTTRAVKKLPYRIESTGFQVKSFRTNFMENFVEIAAIKPLRS